MFRFLACTKPVTSGPPPTSLFRVQQQIRHASSKSKQKNTKKSKASRPTLAGTTTKSTAPSSEAEASTSSTPLISPSHTSWRIEPQLNYMESRLRQPGSGSLYVTLCLTIGSIVGTSVAFPSPEEKERLERELQQAEEEALGATRRALSGDSSPEPGSKNDQRPSKSFLGFLLLPINFVFRPLYATPDERIAAEQTWQFWAGTTSGLCAFSIFVVSRLAAPRYIRMLTVTPPSPTAPSGTLWLTPVVGKPVSYPLAQSTLVSPLWGLGKDRVMKTVTIKGPRGAYLGWGLNMLQGSKGAVLINGQVIQPEQAVVFLENLWVARGGNLDVA